MRILNRRHITNICQSIVNHQTTEAQANNNDQTNTAVLLEKQAATSESSSTQSEQTARDADLLNGSGLGKQGFFCFSKPDPQPSECHLSIPRPHRRNHRSQNRFWASDFLSITEGCYRRQCRDTHG